MKRTRVMFFLALALWLMLQTSWAEEVGNSNTARDLGKDHPNAIQDTGKQEGVYGLGSSMKAATEAAKAAIREKVRAQPANQNNAGFSLRRPAMKD